MSTVCAGAAATTGSGLTLGGSGAKMLSERESRTDGDNSEVYFQDPENKIGGARNVFFSTFLPPSTSIAKTHFFLKFWNVVEEGNTSRPFFSGNERRSTILVFSS